MNRLSGSTGLAHRPHPTPAPAPRVDGEFASVLGLLLATGWVANHFVGLMPAISDRQHLSVAALDAIFGIYALGLLPGLLLGGRASDALGRRAVALTGAATATAGTVAMLVSQDAQVLTVGRLIVGAGVGLAMSSGTAWASDLKGPAGAAIAGAVMIVGFAVGPFAGGLITGAGPLGVRMSFVVATTLVTAAMAATVLTARNPTNVVAAEPDLPPVEAPPGRGAGRALGWALPLAPWVFASATLGFVTIPGRVHTGLAAPVAAGIAALIVNGVSGVMQLIARAAAWGPRTGTAGAVLAALSYALIALAPPYLSPATALPLLVLLGCGSGLCLREGLIDLEAAAPQRVRGTLTGVFYAMTYVGFGLPLLLATVSLDGARLILTTMAVLASAAAVSRAVRLSRDGHRQR